MPELNNNSALSDRHNLSIADTIDSALSTIKMKAKWSKKQNKNSKQMVSQCEKLVSRNNRLKTEVELCLVKAKKA